MSLPPKTDDETSAPDGGAKPVKRGRRGPVRKPAEEKAPQREESQPAIFTPERRPEPEAPPPAQQESHSDGGGSRDVASEQGGGDGRQGETQGQGGGSGGNGGGQGGGRGEWQDRN